MTIEFCGLPGVGKSTIARALESHGFVRVRIQSRWELFIRNLEYFVRFPRAFFQMCVYILRVSISHGRFYRLFMNVLLDTNARIMKARRMGSYAIIDQGHIQALLSLSYHSLSEEEMRTYFSYFPLPDVVCAFEAPATVREAHLNERGYRPREGESSDTKEWFLHLESNAEHVVAFIEKHMPYRTIRVGTYQPVDVSTEYLLSVLKK